MNISAESNTIFKNLVTGPLDHKVSVSAKKEKKLHACVPLIFDICMENLKLEGIKPPVEVLNGKKLEN